MTASRSGQTPGETGGSRDPDGIVRTRSRLDRGGGVNVVLLFLAGVILVAGALWLGLFRGAPPSRSSPSKAASPPADTASPRTRRLDKPFPERPRAPLPSDDEVDPDPVSAPASSAKEGIYAFPPPGTKRIKEGIVVPDDFDLPPGYVRHYQTTDKGEMLPAILMFHPTISPLDARGEPLFSGAPDAPRMPEDRVVPPDMAPPGLPIERLTVPDDAYADPNDPGPLPSDENAPGPDNAPASPNAPRPTPGDTPAPSKDDADR